MPPPPEPASAAAASHDPGPGPDFLGVFGIVARGDELLFVQNRRLLAGVPTLTWDLPGGGVERGELLVEALRREFREEVGLEIVGEPRFAFFQEGERRQGRRRRSTWRSFFYLLDGVAGEARAGAEVLAVRWLPRATLRPHLVAPYHDSFLRWLDGGGAAFASRWDE